jgi:branched-chain amino acid transport system permease protein
MASGSSWGDAVLPQELLNGLTLGATYALVGAAFSLTIGVLGVLNLALSEIFMLGAFVTLSAATAELPFPLALALGAAVGALANLVVERVAYRPLRADPLLPLVGTIACSIVIQGAAVNVWGTDQRTFPSWSEPVSYSFGTITVTPVQLSIWGTALAVLLTLDWLLRRTRLGRNVRAVAENAEVAELLGVSAVDVVRFVFASSGALAAVAGVLVGLIFGQVSPFVGVEVGLKGIAAMVLGGLGNLRATALGGLVLGLTEVLSVAYVSSSYRDVIVYGTIVVALLLRPQGLLGSSARTERL